MGCSYRLSVSVCACACLCIYVSVSTCVYMYLCVRTNASINACMDYALTSEIKLFVTYMAENTFKVPLCRHSDNWWYPSYTVLLLTFKWPLVLRIYLPSDIITIVTMLYTPNLIYVWLDYNILATKWLCVLHGNGIHYRALTRV